jgi:invasion protein IalB
MSALSHILRTAVLSIAVTAFVGPLASAEEAKTPEVYGDWAVECRDAAAEKKLCVLTQTVMTADKKRRLLKLIMGQGEEGAFFTALVPLGVSIPAGVSATIDKNKALPLVLKTCLPQGCIATTRLDEKLAKSIKSGEKLAIGFTMKPGAKPLAINGSLKGVKDGMRAVNL